MWFITHATNGESICFLPEKKLKYTVGRLGADIELQDDICVSRAHAAFHLVKEQDELNLELEDLGSKFGTFHNNNIESNTPLEKGRKITLKSNDLIRFGRLKNVWKVQYMLIRTATSSLSREDNEQLKIYMSTLGGKINDEWSANCTHLTMGEASVTMKLLHALIDQKVVVALEYWKNLFNAANNIKSCLPKPELYRPAFGSDDIDFNCNNKRRSLFNDFTFVFLNRKHYGMYGPIVKAAGGACKDLNSGVQKSFLIKDKVVVIQYTPSTQTQSSQTISTIAEFLQSNSKRVIPEYEIGLAILHCSVEKFCNPCSTMSQSMPLATTTEAGSESMKLDSVDTCATSNLNTDAIDLGILETNTNMITSTPYVNVENVERNTNLEKEKEALPNLHVTETPLENPRKRKINKVVSIDLDESDEYLFQFQTKKPNNKKDDEGENFNESSTKDKVSDITSRESPPTTTEDKEAEDENESKCSSNNKFSKFLQKNQNKKTTQAHLSQSNVPPTDKGTRKRPFIQVLNDNDEGGDDDLFSFGDTQETKKIRKESNEEDDLFSFKETEPFKTKNQIHSNDVDEDSNDMVVTQQFIVSEKIVKKPSAEIPKPKILPCKVSAVEWISRSFGKINIKKETSTSIKNENETGIENIKTEETIKDELNNDLNISNDHRKWLESLKDAIEIQKVSLNNLKCDDKSHNKFKTHLTSTSVNLNASVPNFKKFVKKYQAPAKNNSNLS